MDTPYYSASEAASALGLKYHTFMARVHRGTYSHRRVGNAYVFDRGQIDNLAREEDTEEKCGGK